MSVWFDSFSESLSATVEQRPMWLLACFSLLYFIGTSALAWSNLFWFDEILTYHIVRLPSVGSLWAVLRAGLDLNPPLYFLAARFLRSLFGSSELVLRLPSMIGFWVMSVCLYRFVSRASSPLYGLAALLLPVATTAYRYGFEARAYGLVLGFCGLALVSWQSYARRGSRLGLVMMGLSMVAAVSTHYYALLAVIPLAGGELVRMVAQRRADFRVLGMLGLTGVPLVFFLPQLRMAKAFAPAFFSKPDLATFLTYYGYLLGPAQPFLVIAVILTVVVSCAGKRSTGANVPRLAPTAAEIAVSVGFVLLAYIDILFALLAGSGFAPRYALPSIIGVATLVPILAYTASQGRVAIGAVLALVFFTAFSLREVSASRRFLHNKQSLDAPGFLSAEGTNSLPVVVPNPLEFIKIAHYGATDWKRRAVYVIDLPNSVRYGKSDTADRALMQLRKLTPLNVFDYTEFVSSHPRFLVLGSDSWEIAYLSDHTADIRVIRRYNSEYGKDFLFEVAVQH